MTDRSRRVVAWLIVLALVAPGLFALVAATQSTGARLPVMLLALVAVAVLAFVAVRDVLSRRAGGRRD